MTSAGGEAVHPARLRQRRLALPPGNSRRQPRAARERTSASRAPSSPRRRLRRSSRPRRASGSPRRAGSSTASSGSPTTPCARSSTAAAAARWSRVPVANNVFLALGAHAPARSDSPGRSERDRPGPAVTRSGERDRRSVRRRQLDLRGRRPDRRRAISPSAPRGRRTFRARRPWRASARKGRSAGSSAARSAAAPGDASADDVARLATLVHSTCGTAGSRRSVPRRPVRRPRRGRAGGRALPPASSWSAPPRCDRSAAPTA